MLGKRKAAKKGILVKRKLKEVGRKEKKVQNGKKTDEDEGSDEDVEKM